MNDVTARIDATRLRMLAVLERKGYQVVGGLAFVQDGSRRRRILATDDLRAYFANLALGECAAFQRAWDSGNFRKAALHAYLAGSHHSSSAPRREVEMRSRRAAKATIRAKRDMKRLKRVKQLIASNPRRSVKEFYRVLQLRGISESQFRHFWRRNQCAALKRAALAR